MVSIILNSLPEPIPIFYNYSALQRSLDKLLFTIMLLQYFLGTKIQSIIKNRMKRINIYGRVVIAHRAVGYGLLVFLLLREGKILENNKLLNAKDTEVLRIISYILFLTVYAILYVLKWYSKGSVCSFFLYNTELDDNSWREKVYIAGEKQLLKQQKEESKLESLVEMKEVDYIRQSQTFNVNSKRGSKDLDSKDLYQKRGLLIEKKRK